MSIPEEPRPPMDWSTKHKIVTQVDLLAAVPYIFGFHPNDSLVMIGLDGPTITIGIRGDLPDPDGDPWEIWSLAVDVVKQAVNSKAAAVIVLGYGPAEAVAPVLEAVRSVLDGTPLHINDILRITDNRYFTYLHPGPDQGVPFDTSTTVVAARATVDGQVVLPDRDAMVHSIDPVTGPERDAMLHATITAGDRLQALIAAEGVPAATAAGLTALAQALERYASAGRLDDDELAWLTMHLPNPEVFVEAWLRTGDKPWQEQLWRDVTRRVQPELVAPAASLLAFAAWRRGLGPLALEAAKRALAADPTDKVAGLVAHKLSAGLAPSTLVWPPKDLTPGNGQTDDPQQQQGR